MMDYASVHKDFHGAMSYGLKYVYENYGETGFIDYLKQIGNTIYFSLSQNLARNGLKVLQKHWKRIFDLEGADYELFYENNVLNLKVNKCPAISHMKKYNYRIFDKFCEHCKIINAEICKNAGYKSFTKYDQNKGRCLQKFWKEEI